MPREKEIKRGIHQSTWMSIGNAGIQGITLEGMESPSVR